jgi:hypothetical protein
MTDLERDIHNYNTARNRLIRRASEIRLTLEKVKKALGKDAWSSIPGSDVLPPVTMLKPPERRRGRPVGDKNGKLQELLKDGPKTKRELAQLMNTTLVDLDRVIYGKAFTHKGRLFRLARANGHG